MTRTEFPPPKLAWIVNKLGAPGGGIADWVAPSGHSVFSALIGIAIAITASIVFYGAVIWAALELLAWGRSALRDQPSA
jgi:hypothetical protein